MSDQHNEAERTEAATGCVTVVVDVMGGDEPPQVVLDGIAAALEADAQLTVIACGPAELVEPFAAAHAHCEAQVATQVIAMEEHPVEAIRTKRDSSIVVGCKLVREGRAQGFFSAGSTGACMSAATLVVGRIKGIDRPALTTALPGVKPTVFLDMGANADCKPINIVQFAHMGCAYARVVLGVDKPRVGLLNIGSEDTKGSMEAQARFAALREQVPAFAGNAEGGDLAAGTFDVIVTDGFTGNVALKTMEGTAKFVAATLRAAAAKSPRAALGALLVKPALQEMATTLSGDALGGAALLGLRAPVLVGHGATNPTAIMNGTLTAARCVREDLCGKLAQAIAVEA